MKFNNENRKLFPTYVGLIRLKNKPDMVCDPDIIEKLIEKVNEKWFVFLKDYGRTLHSFDIDEILIKRTKDEDRLLILELLNKQEELSEKPSLSFNQSLLWLKSKSLESLPMSN